MVDVFRGELDANLIYVDASERFLEKVKDVDDPETKRKIIRGKFIEMFTKEEIGRAHV